VGGRFSARRVPQAPLSLIRLGGLSIRELKLPPTGAETQQIIIMGCRCRVGLALRRRVRLLVSSGSRLLWEGASAREGCRRHPIVSLGQEPNIRELKLPLTRAETRQIIIVGSRCSVGLAIRRRVCLLVSSGSRLLWEGASAREGGRRHPLTSSG